jgi:hypothetical protein
MASSQEVPRNNSATIASLKDAAGKVEFTTEDKKGITGDESSDEELHTVEKGYTEVIVDLPPEEGRFPPCAIPGFLVFDCICGSVEYWQCKDCGLGG